LDLICYGHLDENPYIQNPLPIPLDQPHKKSRRKHRHRSSKTRSIIALEKLNPDLQQKLNLVEPIPLNLKQKSNFEDAKNLNWKNLKF